MIPFEKKDVVRSLHHSDSANFSSPLQYIESITHARAKDDGDIIRSVNDIRNGVYLYQTLHKELALGNMAFLEVKNLIVSSCFHAQIQLL